MALDIIGQTLGNSADGRTNFIGGIDNWLTGNSDWNRTQITNAFNASEAQKQRDFEERMSNTAYQRAVEDMKSAGLNPYAIYGSASPASTPSAVGASGGYSGRSGKAFDVIVSGLLSMATSAIAGNVQLVKQAMYDKTILDIAKLKY